MSLIIFSLWQPPSALNIAPPGGKTGGEAHLACENDILKYGGVTSHEDCQQERDTSSVIL